MSQTVKIAPSILAADFARLGESVQTAQAAGADWIHVDIMDGQFVPNLSMGPQIVRSLRPITDLPLDVHLMIVQPENFIAPFADAGADSINVHVEATPHIHRALHMIRERGLRAGIAINPGTPVDALTEVAAEVDTVLVMSVDPGFGGQTFLEHSLDKVRRIRALLGKVGNGDADITLDGGVEPHNTAAIVAAGGTVLVAGSSVFRAEVGIQGAVANLRQVARSIKVGSS